MYDLSSHRQAFPWAFITLILQKPTKCTRTRHAHARTRTHTHTYQRTHTHTYTHSHNYFYVYVYFVNMQKKQKKPQYIFILLQVNVGAVSMLTRLTKNTEQAMPNATSMIRLHAILRQHVLVEMSLTMFTN